MTSALSALLDVRLSRLNAAVHEALVDVLTIQREIHPGIFAVMDGTFAGDSAGSGRKPPFEGNILLASADPVAIDAVSAKLQGFDPTSLDFIRLAHEKGLGVGGSQRH